MKRLYFSILFVLAASFVMAQKASESNEQSPLKTNGNAVTVTLEGDHKNVEAVLKEKFKKLKSKSEKGFQAYKGQIYSPLSSEMLDFYWKVEKRKNNESKVILFLSKGYDNWLTSQEDATTINNAKKMLDDLVSEVRKYELGIAISAQTKVVEKETKNMEKLAKEGEDLVKDHEKLTKEIEQNKVDQETNKNDQEAQKKVVEEQKKLLEELQKKLGQVK